MNRRLVPTCLVALAAACGSGMRGNPDRPIPISLNATTITFGAQQQRAFIADAQGRWLASVSIGQPGQAGFRTDDVIFSSRSPSAEELALAAALAGSPGKEWGARALPLSDEGEGSALSAQERSAVAFVAKMLLIHSASASSVVRDSVDPGGGCPYCTHVAYWENCLHWYIGAWGWSSWTGPGLTSYDLCCDCAGSCNIYNYWYCQ